MPPFPAMNNSIRLKFIISPALTGLFCLLLLAGCQTTPSPEEVSERFWQAMTNNDLVTARQYATTDSQDLISDESKLPWPLQQVTLQMGDSTITDHSAKVTTFVRSPNLPQNRQLSFDTLLLKQDGLWKVDYRHTLESIPTVALQILRENLKIFGEKLGHQFEQQLPFFNQLMREFTEELNQQIEEFNRRFDKKRPNKDQNSI